MSWTDEDRVWNRAAQGGVDELREGDRALAALILAHSLVMNGGVEHALDVLSVDETLAAVTGFRFFSLPEVTDLLEGAMGDGAPDSDELDRRYWQLVPDDEVIVQKFRALYSSSRDSFLPV